MRLGYRRKMQRGVLIPYLCLLFLLGQQCRPARLLTTAQQSPAKTAGADATGNAEGWRRGEKEAG